MAVQSHYDSIAKAINGAAYDERKYVDLLAAHQVSAKNIADSLTAGAADELATDASVRDSDAKVVRALRVYETSLSPAYQALVDFQAVKHAALDLAQKNAPPQLSSGEANTDATDVSYKKLVLARSKELHKVGSAHPDCVRARGEIKEALAARETAREDEDAVVMRPTQVGGSRAVCQITRKLMDDPVRSSGCGHTYERAAILQILRGKHVCPIQGCKKPCEPKMLSDCAETRYLVAVERKRLEEAGAAADHDDDDDDDSE